MMKLAENYPSIVKAYTLILNENGNFVAISMENLSSYYTLFNIFTLPKRDVKPYQRLKMARNCCRALAELHKINLVHGDISSENLLICFNDEDLPVKIIDFDCTH